LFSRLKNKLFFDRFISESVENVFDYVFDVICAKIYHVLYVTGEGLGFGEMFVVEPEAIDNVLAEDEFWDIKLNDALFSDVHFDKFGVS
jgi:hypothetical protein